MAKTHPNTVKATGVDQKEDQSIFQRIWRVVRGHKRLAFVVVIVVTVGSGILYRSLSQRTTNAQYQTTQATKGTIISTVSASGTVLLSNSMKVQSSASGVVTTVYVKNGDVVSKGQQIAEIELDHAGQQNASQAYASYLQAKSSLDSANAAYYSLRSAKDTAWKKFYDMATNETYQNSDGSPRDDIRNSSAEFQSAQGDWLAAELKSKNQQTVIVQAQTAVSSAYLTYEQSAAAIVAPASGKITNITIAPGMLLAPSSTSSSSTTTSGNAASDQTIAVIKSEGDPIISVNTTEVDVVKIAVDQRATITLDSLEGTVLTGRVLTVDKIGSVSSGVTTYPVTIQLDNNLDSILPNMSVSANIIINSKSNVLLVPSTAIQTQNGEKMVRVLRKSQLEYVQVKTGLTSNDQTEITSGLTEGDVVVTSVQTQNNSSSQTTSSPFSGMRLNSGGGAQNVRIGR